MFQTTKKLWKLLHDLQYTYFNICDTVELNKMSKLSINYGFKKYLMCNTIV